MDYSELTAETIKLRIREEVPSRETGLPGEILRLGKIRQDQIGELTARLQESEADRAARLQQITELTGLLQESEADCAARFRQITELTGLLQESEADRAARFRQITELTGLLQESEADRAARLEVIHGLEENITRLQARWDEEKQRADDLEQGWQALEGTFAVRQARRVGLIRTHCYKRRGEQADGD
jgi:chromosome segregation ATPase